MPGSFQLDSVGVNVSVAVIVADGVVVADGLGVGLARQPAIGCADVSCIGGVSKIELIAAAMSAFLGFKT